MPEFISILRWVRDTVYPNIVQSEANINQDRIAVEAVSGRLDEITTAADNALVSEQNAKASEDSALNTLGQINTQVQEATNSAQQASISAQTATQKSDEIKGVSAQAQTLTEGSNATVSYNPADGKFTFGLPRGNQGPKGESYNPDVKRPVADRTLYDSAVTGFGFLATDQGLLYFKLSDTAGDWSVGIPFGQGDPGPQGEQGVSISSLTLVSGDNSPGTFNTYRFTLSDNSTFDFDVYNGADGQVSSVAGRTGDITLTIADIANLQTTINSKQDNLISGSTIKTINNNSLLGSGDIEISELEMLASTVILDGSLSIDNTVNTKNFAVVTYTGNGTTQDIVTGIYSVDFTVANNGSGYWLDRTTNEVKTDAGVVVSNGSCDWGTNKGLSKIHIKSLNVAGNNYIYDGIRGSDLYIKTDTTDIENNTGNYFNVYLSNGFTVSGTGHNTLGNTYIAYQTLYTHIKWGTTNQGKFYVEAYNPVTREGLIYYIGSGVSGHEIPHSMGVKPSFRKVKNLSGTNDWAIKAEPLTEGQILIYTNSGIISNATTYPNDTETSIVYGSVDNATNGLNNEYIAYYKCKSETFDIINNNGVLELKELDGNGNIVRKISKTLNVVGDWKVIDYNRGNDKQILLNTYGAETTVTADVEVNSNTDSYYDYPTDNTFLNLTNGLLGYTDGKDDNNVNQLKEGLITKSIDFTSVSDGFKYVAKEYGLDSCIFLDVEPRLDGVANGDNYYYKDNKWYTNLDVEVANPISFIGKVMVASETPQYIDTSWILPKVIQEDTLINGFFKAKTLNIYSLPTADPFLINELWNDNGTIKISLGE